MIIEVGVLGSGVFEIFDISYGEGGILKFKGEFFVLSFSLIKFVLDFSSIIFIFEGFFMVGVFIGFCILNLVDLDFLFFFEVVSLDILDFFVEVFGFVRFWFLFVSIEGEIFCEGFIFDFLSLFISDDVFFFLF